MRVQDAKKYMKQKEKDKNRNKETERAFIYEKRL